MKRCMKMLNRRFGKPDEKTELKSLIEAFSKDLVAPPLLIGKWVGGGRGVGGGGRGVGGGGRGVGGGG